MNRMTFFLNLGKFRFQKAASKWGSISKGDSSNLIDINILKRASSEANSNSFNIFDRNTGKK